MTRQILHKRRSKRGKVFKAGRGRRKLKQSIHPHFSSRTPNLLRYYIELNLRSGMPPYEAGEEAIRRLERDENRGYAAENEVYDTMVDEPEDIETYDVRSK